MLINRETSPKASPSNKDLSVLRMILAGFLLLEMFTAVPAPVEAQEQMQSAVLLSGPTAVKGIPVYGPNRVPAFLGIYSAAETEIKVLFTRGRLYIGEDWTPRRCGELLFYQVSDYESFALCYRMEGGYFVFFFFSDAEPPAYWCAFASAFVERFLFLSRYIENEVDAPFPAILQLGK